MGGSPQSWPPAHDTACQLDSRIGADPMQWLHKRPIVCLIPTEQVPRSVHLEDQLPSPQCGQFTVTLFQELLPQKAREHERHL